MPVGHNLQCVAPYVSEKDPEAQAGHALAPCCAFADPGLHGMQTTLENSYDQCPGGHFTQWPVAWSMREPLRQTRCSATPKRLPKASATTCCSVGFKTGKTCLVAMNGRACFNFYCVRFVSDCFLFFLFWVWLEVDSQSQTPPGRTTLALTGRSPPRHSDREVA